MLSQGKALDPQEGHWWLDAIADNQKVAQCRALDSLKQETNFR